jgi:hypothetical protein
MIKKFDIINQKLKLNKQTYLQLFLSIVLSSIIFYLSLNENIWPNFWGSLKIPPNIVPFSDFKAHLLFFNCEAIGIDVNSQECILIPDGNAKINSHPKIWIHLFNILNLQNTYIYNFSILFLLTLYFYIICRLFEQFKTAGKKFFLFVLFFSTTNFILIERLATDLIIFILAFIALNVRNKILQGFFIFIGFILKYFPIFIASVFIEKKKFLFLFITSVTIFSYAFYLSNFYPSNNNMVEMALPVAYGARTMLKAFYHLSVEYNYFLNDVNINFYRNLVILLCLLYVLFFILIGYLLENKKNNGLPFEKYFLAGASIYVGTFIIGANADYRLIFLLFTIPHIMSLKNKNIKYLLIFCYFFSFNSFYFLSGAMLSTTFFLKASFIFSCKILILSLLSFLIGSQMKKVEFFKL